MCEPDENRRLWEARETLMSWLITLEALSAQEEIYIRLLAFQEKKSARINNNILNRHIPRKRSRPQQTGRITINTGRQFSFVTSQDCSFPSWCALQLQLVRRFGGGLQVQLQQQLVSVLA
jgi:hypothetical protein